ncbi:MAG TPA: chorismate lyase [Burkholderiaceae bacterium]|nr:chorismate lyase [Burkholderiaceae bacterium]
MTAFESRTFRQSRWRFDFPHDPAIPLHVRRWITGAGSLTQRLISASTTFRVQLLSQQPMPPLADEWRRLGMRWQRPVVTREVVLLCDDEPVVFAHTVARPDRMRQDWPFLRGLGHRSLGSALFIDPQVTRTPFEFARLAPHHPLMQRAFLALPALPPDRPLLARRSVFRRAQGAMLVTEIFLPSLARLRPPHQVQFG